MCPIGQVPWSMRQGSPEVSGKPNLSIAEFGHDWKVHEQSKQFSFCRVGNYDRNVGICHLLKIVQSCTGSCPVQPKRENPLLTFVS